mgnify:CR=1 FL=1
MQQENMQSVKLLKQKIRRETLAARNQMPERVWADKSRRIAERILMHPALTAAEHILCYVNYQKEAETVYLIEQCLARGKKAYCPLVSGSEMDFYRIFALSELQSGFRGIPEPPHRQECLYVPDAQKQNALMIMPGAVFDRQRRRIGYGGGYYDRYLQRAGAIVTMAAAFALQVKETIPSEPHDIRPDIIMTENGIV